MTEGLWYDPLLVAVRDAHGQVTASTIVNLVDHGANIHASDWGKNTSLHYLASGDNVEGIRVLLDRGADIDALNAETKTPLYMAIECRAFAAADFLLKSGANFKRKCTYHQFTALHMAAKQGNMELVKELLARRAKVDMLSKDKLTALMCACESGHDEAIALLLQHGADICKQDIYGRVPLHFACVSGNEDCIRRVYDADPDAIIAMTRDVRSMPFPKWNAMCFAASVGAMRGFQFLATQIERRCPLQEAMYRALFVAVRHGHLELVKWVLDLGNYSLEALQNSGIMCCAALSKKTEVVKVLLDYGFDINRRDSEGTPPLICAVISDDAPMVNYFISAGAVVHEVDSDGWSPLYHAVSHKNVECVRVLLEYGADPFLGSDGVRPIDRACSSSEYAKVLDCIKEVLGSNKQ